VLATDSARPKTRPDPRLHPHQWATPIPRAGGDGDLDQRARHRDAPHGEQVFHREVEAHPEHQQDDADLGELSRELEVGDEARRGRPDHDAGQQIADERRQPEPGRDEPENEGQAERRGQRRDQGQVVRHGRGLHHGLYAFEHSLLYSSWRSLR
jgi:hypothetical protein